MLPHSVMRLKWLRAESSRGLHMRLQSLYAECLTHQKTSVRVSSDHYWQNLHSVISQKCWCQPNSNPCPIANLNLIFLWNGS